MTPKGLRLLRLALTRPDALPRLGGAEWSELLFRARGSALLGRLAAEAERAGIMGELPPPVRDQLIAGKRAGELSRRRITWEVDRLKRAFFERPVKLVLLKGAAYAAADFPWAAGRVSSDIDVMVDRADLQLAEATLLAAGWQPVQHSAYDERYYREWMHEIPPLRHPDRGTLMDLHHTILPLTGRLRPDPAALLADARAIDGHIHVLSPADMLLHSIVHLFQDGAIRGGLRDLVDQRDMMAHFGADPAFWRDLVTRAEMFGLGRPLHYSVRYAVRLLDAPVPPEVVADIARRFAPPAPLGAVMDALVVKAIAPPFLFHGTRGSGLAARLLYMRSHWLRMPPGLLARHLARKAVARLRPAR